ncbi:Tetratricopeptide repeat protein 16 [Gonapodya sp. JEL0774]|nr:Tetratricopeptide repeat protein 16 [Gonapodya sp. JEL0774]
MSKTLQKLQLEQAEINNRRCLTYVEGRDFRRACIEFSRAILLAPNEPSYYLHRAEALRELGDLVASAANYRKALLLIDEKNLERAGKLHLENRLVTATPPRFVQRRLAACLLDQGTKLVLCEELSSVREGMELLHQSWELFAPSIPLMSSNDGRCIRVPDHPSGIAPPMDVEDWRKSLLPIVARGHMKLSQYEQAIEVLYRLTYLFENNVEFWVLRSKAHKALGMTALVKFDRDRIVRLDSSPKLIEHLTAYLVEKSIEHKNTADTLAIQNELELAAVSFTTALELDPQDTWSKLKRARVYERLDKLDLALRDYEATLATNAEEIYDTLRTRIELRIASIHHKLGEMALNRTDFRAAIAAFDRAVVNSQTKEPRYLKSRADAYLAAGDRNRALADYSRTIELTVECTNELTKTPTPAADSRTPSSLTVPEVNEGSTVLIRPSLSEKESVDQNSPGLKPITATDLQEMRATCTNILLENAEALFSRGAYVEVVRVCTKDVESAKLDLQRILALNPRHPDARSMLDNLTREGFEIVKAFPAGKTRKEGDSKKRKSIKIKKEGPTVVLSGKGMNGGRANASSTPAQASRPQSGESSHTLENS